MSTNKYESILKEYMETAENCICAAVRSNGGFVLYNGGEMTRFDANAALSSDIERTISDIFSAQADMNGIIFSKSFFTLAMAEAGIPIPPILDDLAQIVGAKVKCGGFSDAVRMLKGKNACLIKGRGALSIGRTLDEADTAMKVLEKGAKAYAEGTIIGGTKAISFLEANLMHIIYKLKYSKKDQQAKQEELNG